MSAENGRAFGKLTACSWVVCAMQGMYGPCSGTGMRAPHAQARRAGVGQDEALGAQARCCGDDVAHAGLVLAARRAQRLQPRVHARQHRIRAACKWCHDITHLPGNSITKRPQLMHAFVTLSVCISERVTVYLGL